MASPTVREMTAYIREAAKARGIDPNTAVKVARSEGLGEGVWQSNVVKGGRRETSYGPYQLLVGGGLGDQFKKLTGKSPSDKGTWQQQIDFALDYAADNGWGSWYGAAKVGVSKWTGLKGAQPVGISQASETAAAEAAPPEMAGGLGALLSGDWVEPMLAANQDRIGNRIESAFAPGAMPSGPAGALERLASLGADPASARVSQAFGGLGSDPASDRVGSAFSTALSAPPVAGGGDALARAVASVQARDPTARVNQAFAAGPAVQQLNPGAPAAIDRIRAEYAARAPQPTVQASTVAPVMAAKTDRLPASPPPATMATASINPNADPRAAAYASGIKPGSTPLTPQSLVRGAEILDSALGPLGHNIMRGLNVLTPRSGGSESFPAGTEEMAGRTRSPIRKESKGQPGANYAGSGLSAISSVRSGHSPVGTYAQSRSDPSVSVVSLPGGNVAHVNDKMGFISTWSEADQDEKGVHYGKTLAIDPTGSKYGYFSPGKVPTGWATYSHGKGFKGSIAPGKTAAPTFGPGIFGMFGNKSAGKSSGPSLGGFLSGLFGGRGVAPGKSLGNQAVGQAVGLAAGLFGPAGGMGGLGLGGGFGGPAGQVGGLGAPGFGGQISSNNNYGGR